MRRPWLAVVLLGACGGTRPVPAPAPPPPPATPQAVASPSCDDLHISIAATATTADTPTVYTSDDVPSAQADAIAAAAEGGIAACHEDRWTAEEIACFARAKSDGDQFACGGELTPEHADGLRLHVDDAVQKTKSAVIERHAGSQAVLARWQDAARRLAVPECDELTRAIEAFLGCDKISEAERRETAMTDLRAVRGAARVDDPNLSDADLRKGLVDVCSQGLAAIRQSATAAGCPAP